MKKVKKNRMRYTAMSVMALLIWCCALSTPSQAAGPAYRIDLSPNPAVLAVGASSEMSISARVIKTSDSSPVPNVSVSFSTTSGSVNPWSDTTNAQGNMSIALTAGTQTGEGTLSASATIQDENYSASVPVWVVAVEMVNPSGDPTNSAQAQEGVNEFTFDTADPGVLNISCRATLVPDNDATRQWAEQNVIWTVDGVGDSTQSWLGGGADNKGAEVTCRFTGLPTSNGAFGMKNVTLTVAGSTTTRQIQVFFNRDSTNHPGGDQTRDGRNSTRSPNWFYYWEPNRCGRF